MKSLIGLALAILLFQSADCQANRYIIRFKDKAGTQFSLTSPNAYLTQRAIARRSRYAIALDSTDLPVSPRYIDSIRLAGNVSILNRSKWLNAITIFSTDAAALTKINSFPFVRSVSIIAQRAPVINKPETNEINGNPRPLNIEADYFDYGSSFNQVHIHNGEFLHNIGLRGQGMNVGIVDAGFFGYLTLKAFDSVRAAGQILDVFDFVVKDSSVNEDASHGMQCFSTIAANIPGQFVGTAPKSSFYLYRTEDANSEFPIEEFNWVAAVERVDSLGGDVLSSSLGYNIFDAPLSAYSYTYADMNGNTSISSTGADLAAKKGILVVNSAGNSGNDAWHYIVTPADADSILAVGAVSAAGVVGTFSSYGPSSDGQVKPDVASVGIQTTVQLTNNTIGTNSGTSFAAPNMAGLVTCLWQGFPEFNNMRIIEAVRRSGSIATMPNDRIGYGIPDMKKATLDLLKSFSTSTLNISNCTATLSWTSKDNSSMQYRLERLDPVSMVYVPVATVNGTGTSFGTHTYQYSGMLNNIPPGQVSFRIRQVIDTSASGFSSDYIDTVSVLLTSNCGYTTTETVTLSPNPSRESVNVRINITDAVPTLSIQVYNTKGQLLYRRFFDKPIGFVTYPVSLMQFPAGKYYVVVSNGEKKLTTKELIRL